MAGVGSRRAPRRRRNAEEYLELHQFKFGSELPSSDPVQRTLLETPDQFLSARKRLPLVPEPAGHLVLLGQRRKQKESAKLTFLGLLHLDPDPVEPAEQPLLPEPPQDRKQLPDHHVGDSRLFGLPQRRGAIPSARLYDALLVLHGEPGLQNRQLSAFLWNDLRIPLLAQELFFQKTRGDSAGCQPSQFALYRLLLLLEKFARLGGSDHFKEQFWMQKFFLLSYS